MVLMRMMLSGKRSSEMRIWFSWSYTDFLGTCGRDYHITAGMRTCRGLRMGSASPLTTGELAHTHATAHELTQTH